MKRSKATITHRHAGTRVELLEHLADPLDNHAHQDVLTDGTEPEMLDQNFPNLSEQSQHWTLNREQRSAFLLIDTALLLGVLLVGEFSMITPLMFDLMEDRLRKLKEQPDIPYGGVHVIFRGDFYQLLPVGYGQIYSEQAAAVGRNAIKAANGWRFWKTCLTDVIELKQNHRLLDLVWASSLERFRINSPTHDDIQLVIHVRRPAHRRPPSQVHHDGSTL